MITYQVELVDIDALVTGQGRVPGSGLEPEPTLILELLLLCVLAQVDGPLWKKYFTVEITKLRLKKNDQRVFYDVDRASKWTIFIELN